MKLIRSYLLFELLISLVSSVYASNNQQIINANILDKRATFLTSTDNLGDFKDLLIDSYKVNISIKGDFIKYDSLYLNKDNITLKDMLDYGENYYHYKWYIHGNKIIIDTLVNNKIDMNNLWEVRTSDKNLRALLTRWCQDSGWSLIWDAKYDYLIDASWQINDSFSNAINKILSSFNIGNKKLLATMYSENKVLVITSH